VEMAFFIFKMATNKSYLFTTCFIGTNGVVDFFGRESAADTFS
jgi:hypothetical protein